MSRNACIQSWSRIGPPLLTWLAVLNLMVVSSAHAIMAGGETVYPTDSPAIRLDPLGASSPFNAVGALSINSGGFNYYGSATAISPNWVLTAGHNVDLNDNGQPDPGLSLNFYLPGYGVYSATSFYTCPGFTGFGNPSVQRDLSLLYFSTPLPAGILYPSLQGSLSLGSQVTLAGFGQSGFGSYGYTTQASLTDRRTGQNVIDSFDNDNSAGGLHGVFYYDFDSPNSTGLPGGSLGNNIETLIGPGDSGGALLLANGSGYSLVGVNTFVEGYGGHFGDVGGGVVLEPYLDWIGQTTGISVPEPTVFSLALLGFILVLLRRRGTLPVAVGVKKDA